jgi:hypothetical protein
MADGQTVRCQGVSVSRLNKWREKFGDPNAAADSTWPETQCSQPAVPEGYVCRFHGGLNLIKYKAGTIADTLPYDLSEIFQKLAARPDYISRKDDILLIEARIIQLLGRLSEESGTQEAWGLVSEAYTQTLVGNTELASTLLKQALSATDTEKDIWKEIRTTESLLQSLTTTQVKTAKELRAMATTEQVSTLMNNLNKAIIESVNKNVANEHERTAVLTDLSRRIADFTRTGDGTVFAAVASGSHTAN